MPDFTARGSFGRTSVAINNYGDTMLGETLRCTTSTASTNVYTTANTAIYCPFILPWSFLAQNILVRVTTQSGNIDVGIYNEKGTRLVSSGSTTVAAAGTQVFNITDTWLTAGTYFMAVNVDNTTAAFHSMVNTVLVDSIGRANGLQIQAVGAVTLPNPATFAAYTALSVPMMSVIGNATT